MTDSRKLTYTAITPARDEAAHLARVSAALGAQTLPPSAWLIVDNGSTDGTLSVAQKLAAAHAWVLVVEMDGTPTPTRGGPVVQAFERGVEALTHPTDVVVKLDADVSFGADFFEQLLTEFEKDPLLGVASGVAWEEHDGGWRRRRATRPHIHGPVHAYRRTCLDEISPLEARMGWDTIDAVKAEVAGWHARNFEHLPFRHHRAGGTRDGRFRAWVNHGRAAHYLGYRPSYLVLRTAYQVTRNPASIGLLRGYVSARIRREPQCPDPSVVRRIRDSQRLRHLPDRVREATGRTRNG
jgi:glycosyltransferase involved in cell wall biosynthesis